METKSPLSGGALILLLAGNAILIAVALTVPDLLVGVIAAGLLVTLAEWFVLRTLAGRASALPAPAPVPVAPLPPPPPRLEKPAQPPEAAAVQILSILQRQGRLIDFLQEDIRPYDDAQIGAAVRAVHEGCRSALAEHVTLEPVMDQPEGNPVTVDAGFDANAVRLSGNVTGNPPFRGELRHRGWRVAKLQLPELKHTQERIVAPAEVEVG